MPVNEREVEELLSDLVRIDSVTPWLIPDGAGEGAIARFMADWLAPLGVEVELEEVEPGRPNLVARLPGTGGGRSLCLNAHSDTVGYANWADRALVPERRGDHLIGVGVADDKSGCAVGLLALRDLARSGPRLRGDVVLACTIDEEGSSIGTTDLVRRHTYDGGHGPRAARRRARRGRAPGLRLARHHRPRQAGPRLGPRRGDRCDRPHGPGDRRAGRARHAVQGAARSAQRPDGAPHGHDRRRD